MHHKLIQSQHRKSRVASAEGLIVFPLMSESSGSRQQVSTMDEIDTQIHWLWMRFNHVYHSSWHNEGLALRQNNFLTPSSITARVIPGKHGISACFWPTGISNKMFCCLKEKRTKWNIFLYFVEKIMHQILLNLSLNCTSQMYRRNPGEMVLLHQPAKTAGGLTPSTVLLSSPTSFHVYVPTTHPWLLLGDREFCGGGQGNIGISDVPNIGGINRNKVWTSAGLIDRIYS